MKLDARIKQLQESLKWFKDEALNLSSIVEKKNKQIKDIQGEYALIQNEISLLTEALKRQKKENKLCKTALNEQ
jgi:chromosome segregation ATPase